MIIFQIIFSKQLVTEKKEEIIRNSSSNDACPWRKQWSKRLKVKIYWYIYCLSTSLIKECVNEIGKPLTISINTSFGSVVIPEMFKIVKVTPMFKVGAFSTCWQHRPVSLMPIFSKVIVNLFLNRFTIF